MKVTFPAPAESTLESTEIEILKSAAKLCENAVQQRIDCPACGAAIAAQWRSQAIESQTATIKIAFGTGVPDVQSVGEVMVNFAKMYRALMKEYGFRCSTTIECVKFEGTEFELKMLVAAIGPELHK